VRGQPPGAESLDAMIRARVAAPFDLARGPLFAADVLRVSDHRRVLLVCLHHIVGDAGSIRIILDEAQQLYAAFRRQEAASTLPLLAIQYRDFVAWQQALAIDSGRARSRRYWLDALGGPLPRTGFVPDTPEQATPTSDGRVIVCDLDAALTVQVRQLAARHGTTLFGVIVSAVYALLYRYRQQEDLIIGSTISRRDHPWLEHQVGCYIDMLVLRGRAGGRDTAGDLIERTARICRDALAHRDYPFDSLLADLNVTTPPGKSPIFDVLVDHVPGPAAVNDMAAETGLAISEYERGSEAAHYDTMFVLGESDSGARLSIQLVFNAGLFGADTVALIQTRLMTIVKWLAEDGIATLGDVELLSVPAAPRPRLRVGLNTR
jgi:hypothetical protein